MRPKTVLPPGNEFPSGVSSLFGLAPGGVYPANLVTKTAVRSYRTFSPLPSGEGGIFSVALSLRSPAPDVIRHRVSVEPGLSSSFRLRPSDSLVGETLPHRPAKSNVFMELFWAAIRSFRALSQLFLHQRLQLLNGVKISFADFLRRLENVRHEVPLKRRNAGFQIDFRVVSELR